MTIASFQPAGASAPFFQAPYCMAVEAAVRVVSYAENFEFDILKKYMRDIVGNDERKFAPTILWFAQGLSFTRPVDFDRVQWSILRMSNKVNVDPLAVGKLMTTNELAANGSVGTAIAGALFLLGFESLAPGTVGVIAAGVATVLTMFRYSLWSLPEDNGPMKLREQLRTVESQSYEIRERIKNLLLRWYDYSEGDRESRFEDYREALEDLIKTFEKLLSKLGSLRKEILYSPHSSDQKRTEEVAFWTMQYIYHHRRFMELQQFTRQITSESRHPFRTWLRN